MFEEYYKKYMGFSDNNLQEDLSVFSSEYRDKLFSFTYKNPIIATRMQERIIFSVAPKHFDDFCKYSENFNQLDFESLDFQKKIDDFFATNYSSYFTIDRYYRMTVDKDSLATINNLEIVRLLRLSDKEIYLEKHRNRGEIFKNNRWKIYKPLIEEGRIFIIEENHRIVSYASITDIDLNGANIAVSTNPDYRNKGYGKKVVYKAVEWCLRNGLIPIYWTRTDNLPSVKLAVSLGFKRKAEEIAVLIPV